ncbi:MAG: RNase adapter RapZ [Thermodesulfovibrionales bacterium]|nr:RNase adapter RapZ [Thermodesulfovibrionales bacterium]
MENKYALPLDTIIITGLSGSGKSVALKTLEDLGFFCIDNLPINLLEIFLSTIDKEKKKIAIGVDIREGVYLPEINHILAKIKEKYNLTILFFEAEKEVLIRRYKETRRPHPLLYLKGLNNLEDAVIEERKMLNSIRETADKIIDTSSFSPHQLRRYMSSHYGKREGDRGLIVELISFGFKYGVPDSLDLLFDVRFLPNPYFVPELKMLKGVDKEVSDYVLNQPETQKFLQHIKTFLDFLIPNYQKEERSYLLIGIGCTGGRHRSPVIIEVLSKYLERMHKIKVNTVHRDME